MSPDLRDALKELPNWARELVDFEMDRLQQEIEQLKPDAEKYRTIVRIRKGAEWGHRCGCEFPHDDDPEQRPIRWCAFHAKIRDQRDTLQRQVDELQKMLWKKIAFLAQEIMDDDIPDSNAERIRKKVIFPIKETLLANTQKADTAIQKSNRLAASELKTQRAVVAKHEADKEKNDER